MTTFNPYAGSGDCGDPSTGPLLETSICQWLGVSERWNAWGDTLIGFWVDDDPPILWRVVDGQIEEQEISTTSFQFLRIGPDSSVYGARNIGAGGRVVMQINPYTGAILQSGDYPGVGIESMAVGANHVYVRDFDKAIVRCDRSTLQNWELVAGNDVLNGGYDPNNPPSGEVNGSVGTSRLYATLGGARVGMLEAGDYLYFVDGSAVRRTHTTSLVTSTFAGVSSTSGHTNGVGTSARFNAPSGLAWDGQDLFVTESDINSFSRTVTNIRKITDAAVVSTYFDGVVYSDSTGGAVLGIDNISIADDGKFFVEFNLRDVGLEQQVKTLEPSVNTRAGNRVSMTAQALVGTPGRNGTTFGQRVRPDVGITKYARLNLFDANAEFAPSITGVRTAPGAAGLVGTATLRFHRWLSGPISLTATATCGVEGFLGVVTYYSPAPSGANGFIFPTVRKVDDGKLIVGYMDMDSVTFPGSTQKFSVVLGRWNEGAAPAEVGTPVVVNGSTPADEWDFRVTQPGTLYIFWTTSFVFQSRNTAATYSDLTLSLGTEWWTDSFAPTVRTSDIIPGTDNSDELNSYRFMLRGSATTLGISTGLDAWNGPLMDMPGYEGQNLYGASSRPCALNHDVGLIYQRNFSADPNRSYIRTVYLNDLGPRLGPATVLPTFNVWLSQPDLNGVVIERIDDRRALIAYVVTGTSSHPLAQVALVTLNDDDTHTIGGWVELNPFQDNGGEVQLCVLDEERAFLLTSHSPGITFDDYEVALYQLTIDAEGVRAGSPQLLDHASRGDIEALDSRHAAHVYREKATGRIAGQLLTWKRVRLTAGASLSVRTVPTAAADLSASATINAKGSPRPAARLSQGVSLSAYGQKNPTWPAAGNDIILGKSHRILWFTANRLQFIKDHPVGSLGWYYTEDGVALTNETVVVAGETTWSDREDRRASGMLLNKYGSDETDYTWGNTALTGSHYTMALRTSTNVWMGHANGLVRLNESGVQQATATGAGFVWRGAFNAAGNRIFYTKYSVPDSQEARSSVSSIQAQNLSHSGVFQWNTQNNSDLGAWITDNGWIGRGTAAATEEPRGDIAIRVSNNDVLVVKHGIGVEHYNSSAVLQRTYTWDDEPSFHIHRTALHASGDTLYCAGITHDGRERIWIAYLSTGVEGPSAPIPREFSNGLIRSLWGSSFAFAANRFGVAVLSDSPDVIVVGTREVPAIAALTADALVTVIGARKWAGVINTSAGATLSASATTKKFGKATPSASGTLTAKAIGIRRNNQSLMTAVGTTLTATGVRERLGVANLTVTTTTLTAVALKKAVGKAVVSAGATVAISPYVRWQAVADLDAFATLSPVGVREVLAAPAALTGSATVTALGVRERLGIAALTVSATVTAVPHVHWKANASLSSGATLTAVGIRERLGLADEAAGATLTVIGTREVPGDADLVATASLDGAGLQVQLGLVQMSATASMPHAYRDVVLATPDLRVYYELNETSGTAAIDATPARIDGTYTTSAVLRGQPTEVVGSGTQIQRSAVAAATMVNTPTDPAIDLTNAMSFEFWLTMPSYGDTVGTLTLSRKLITNAETNWRVELFLGAAAAANIGRVRLRGTIGGIITTLANLSAVIPEGTQHQVVVTYDDTIGGVVYVDGVPNALKAPVGSVPTNTAAMLLQGGEQLLLDEYSVYARALTSDEVLQHLRAGRSGTAYAIRYASASLSGTSDCDVIGTRSRSGDAANSGGATLTVKGARAQLSDAALNADATLSVTGTRRQLGTLTISAGATATSVARLRWLNNPAVLTATATVTSTAIRAANATATLSATATASATGAGRAFGITAATASANIDIVPYIRWKALAVLSSQQSVLTAVGLGRRFASAVPSGGATVAVIGTRKVNGTIALSAEASIALVAYQGWLASAATQANADLTVVGVLRQTATAVLSADATTLATGRNKWFGEVTASAGATCTATALRRQNATTTLTSSATVTTAGYIRWLAQTALSAGATVTAIGRQQWDGLAALDGNANLDSVGARAQPGVAALTGSATLDATPRVAWFAQASLHGSAEVAVASYAVSYAQALLTGDARFIGITSGFALGRIVASAEATIAVTAIQVQQASVTISGDASVVGAGYARTSSAADLFSDASLSAVASRAQLAVVDVAASATLTVTAVGVRFADAAVSAEAAVEVNGVLAQPGQADALSSAEVIVSAVVVSSGVAEISSTADVTTDATRVQSSDVLVVGQASITVAAYVSAPGQVSCEAVAALSVDAYLRWFADVVLRAEADLNLTPSGVVFGAWELSATADCVSESVRGVHGDVEMDAAASTTTSSYARSFGLALLEPAATLSGTPTITAVGAADLSASADTALAEQLIQFALVLATAESELSVEGIRVVTESVTLVGESFFAVLSIAVAAGQGALDAQASLETAYSPFRFGVIFITTEADVFAVALRIVSATAVASAEAIVAPIPALHRVKRYAEPDVDISISGLPQTINVIGRDLSIEVLGPNVVPEAKGQEMESSILERVIETRTDESLDILI